MVVGAETARLAPGERTTRWNLTSDQLEDELSDSFRFMLTLPRIVVRIRTCDAFAWLPVSCLALHFVKNTTNTITTTTTTAASSDSSASDSCSRQSLSPVPIVYLGWLYHDWKGKPLLHPNKRHVSTSTQRSVGFQHFSCIWVSCTCVLRNLRPLCIS